MSVSRIILAAAVTAGAFLATASLHAQQTRFLPDRGGVSPGQPGGTTFYHRQLGVTFTRVDVGTGTGNGGGGESRPMIRFNPDGGGVGFRKGLRIDSVDFNGLGRQVGFEAGDVVVRCETSSEYQTQFNPGGNTWTRFDVIDIRTGRTVVASVPGVRINLDIDGHVGRPEVCPGDGWGGFPGTGPGLIINPGGESRPHIRSPNRIR